MFQSNINARTIIEQWAIPITDKLWQLLLIFISTRVWVSNFLEVAIFPITHWAGRFSFFIFCLFLSNLKLAIFRNIELRWSMKVCQLLFSGLGGRTYNSFGTRVKKGLNQSWIKPICSCAKYDPIPPSSNLQLFKTKGKRVILEKHFFDRLE